MYNIWLAEGVRHVLDVSPGLNTATNTSVSQPVLSFSCRFSEI